jgi:hypothetical protein
MADDSLYIAGAGMRNPRLEIPKAGFEMSLAIPLLPVGVQCSMIEHSTLNFEL